MLIINKSARLITINFDGKKYPLMPAGNAVEIPDEAREESNFLKGLLKDRSVQIVQDDSEDEVDPLAELRQEAIDLGVQGVTKRWGEAKLREAIEAAKDDGGSDDDPDQGGDQE